MGHLAHTISLLLAAQILLSHCPSCQATPLPPTKFLFIHGAFQAAFVWHKLVAVLRAVPGFEVKAVDLASCGLDKTPTCSVTSIKVWAANAEEYMLSLKESEKVIVVAHSAGGVAAQYISEKFSKKIRATVYIASIFVPPGQPAAPYIGSNDSLLSAPGALTYGTCDLAVTSVKSVTTTFCNGCSPSDIALLELLSEKQPLLPFVEVNSLTPKNYGSVKRVWVRTLLDKTVTRSHQDYLLSLQPPPAKIYDIASGHQPMLATSKKLIKILKKVAAKFT